MEIRTLRSAVGAPLLTGIAITAFLTTAPPAAAQQTSDAQEDEDIVVVTGSYIRRTEEGALPVTVISRDQIERTGATTVEQFVHTLTSATQGNNNVVAATSAGFNAGGVSGISLRGLGSQRTLVLINGRRSSAGGTLTDSTTVDVNSIPLTAVERVEVLKDGASAVYGSDAIAGVINFILRRNYQGADLDLYYGDTDDGGAVGRRGTLTFGFGDLGTDRYNVLFVANYQEEGGLFGRQRDFARSSINAGALNDASSGNTFPANIVIPTLDAQGNSVAVTANPNYPNCSPSVVSPLFAALDSPQCRYDPAPLVSLLPDSERSNLYGTVNFALTSNVHGYAEGSFSHNRQHTIIQGAPISDQFALPPTHPLVNQAPYNAGTPGVGFATIVLSPTSPYYPTSYVQGITGGTSPDLLVRYRSVNIGNRDFTDIADMTRGVLGVQGTVAGWDFDVPLLYSQTDLKERINDGIALYSRILPLLNSGQVNFFGENTPDIQAQLDATEFHGEAYKTITSLMSLAPTASRTLVDLPAGPLAMAIGAELREEQFETRMAPALLIGDTTHYGGSNLPVDRSRRVTSLFTEFQIPIVGTFSSNLAVRYDDYENTGSKTTPKVGLRWQPVEQLLLRASYGKGFRAPSLSELHQPQITGVSAAGLNDPARCRRADNNGNVNVDSRDCLTQFNILLGGNTDLQPEESDNYTLGLVYQPLRSISVSLDAFQVKLKDTIIFGVDPSAILADPDRFNAFITRGAADPATPGLPGHIVQINQTNLNFGETKIRGLDVDLRWRSQDTPAGHFTVALNGTYFDQFEVQNLDGSFSSVAGKVSPIVNGAGGAIPRWHHFLSLGWGMQDWEVNLMQNFQAGYKDIPGTFEDPLDPAYKPREVGSYMRYDLQAAYKGIRHMRVSLGINNVLNRDPPYTNAGGQNYFQAGYDPGYVDPRGRFFYGSLAYSFK